jgi:hypothetical protein
MRSARYKASAFSLEKMEDIRSSPLPASPVFPPQLKKCLVPSRPRSCEPNPGESFLEVATVRYSVSHLLGVDRRVYRLWNDRIDDSFEVIAVELFGRLARIDQPPVAARRPAIFQSPASKGADDLYVTRADSLSWGKLTTSNFQVYVRRGEHFLLVSDRDFILHMINRELAGYASCQSQPPLCFVETVNGER